LEFSDTICALSTPSGHGAIAILRISGPDALTIGSNIFYIKENKAALKEQVANKVLYGKIKYENEDIDNVLLSIFKAPHSYTGEDIVEISCHGSTYVQQKILEILVQEGARIAGPGEYTMRAFLNGKMDLSQAEGVADLIASESAAAHRLAVNQIRGGFSEEIGKLRNELLQFICLIELELDFSEEDVEFADRKQLDFLLGKIERMLFSLIKSFQYGNAVKNGVPVAIIGPTNAGKSTLLNRLLREEKAIVSEIAGTTRDYIEDTIILDGIQFRFIDTAGLRSTMDEIEVEGINRTMQKYRKADIVLVIIDINDSIDITSESLQFLNKQEQKNKHIIFVLNKNDLVDKKEINAKIRLYNKHWGNIAEVITISAKQGDSMKELEQLLVSKIAEKGKSETGVAVTNVRHYEALLLSSQALDRAKKGLNASLPTDLLAQDIREILHYLGEITGEFTTDEILGNIFKNFCIGK
jgi:tRNA modification GTPase